LGRDAERKRREERRAFNRLELKIQIAAPQRIGGALPVQLADELVEIGITQWVAHGD
jgi:hypothetical protein